VVLRGEISLISPGAVLFEDVDSPKHSSSGAPVANSGLWESKSFNAFSAASRSSSCPQRGLAGVRP